MTAKSAIPNFNTIHTTLVGVTSHGSGGRASIISAHHRVTDNWADSSLTSREFTKYAIGTHLIVKLAVNSTRRKILSITALNRDDLAYSRRGFQSQFSELLENEAERYNKLAGIFGGESIEPVTYTAPTPEPPTEEWFADFYINPEHMEAFKAAHKMVKATGHPTKIMMSGPSGYGKTSLPKAYASMNEMNYVRFNVALVRDPEEFFGFRTIENGDVEFIPSEFTKAITQGNTVVVLDELNRTSPEMANALFPILDDDARTFVWGHEIAVAENTIIVSTVNLGYLFTGTFSMDQALVNRMDMVIEVGPLPEDIEVQVLERRTNITHGFARQIVRGVNILRNLNQKGETELDASTRTSLKLANLVANGGMSVRDAFRFVVINGANIDERKQILDSLASVI